MHESLPLPYGLLLAMDDFNAPASIVELDLQYVALVLIEEVEVANPENRQKYIAKSRMVNMQKKFFWNKKAALNLQDFTGLEVDDLIALQLVLSLDFWHLFVLNTRNRHGQVAPFFIESDRNHFPRPTQSEVKALLRKAFL